MCTYHLLVVLVTARVSTSEDSSTTFTVVDNLAVLRDRCDTDDVGAVDVTVSTTVVLVVTSVTSSESVDGSLTLTSLQNTTRS